MLHAIAMPPMANNDEEPSDLGMASSVGTWLLGDGGGVEPEGLSATPGAACEAHDDHGALDAGGGGRVAPIEAVSMEELDGGERSHIGESATGPTLGLVQLIPPQSPKNLFNPCLTEQALFFDRKAYMTSFIKNQTTLIVC